MTAIQIFPAIDMRGGKCVRLFKGDYAQETVYGDSPFDMAKSFADAGATFIHMVDLDGAKVVNVYMQKMLSALQMNYLCAYKLVAVSEQKKMFHFI